MGSRQAVVFSESLVLAAEKVLRVGWRCIVHPGRLHAQVSTAVYTHLRYADDISSHSDPRPVSRGQRWLTKRPTKAALAKTKPVLSTVSLVFRQALWVILL